MKIGDKIFLAAIENLDFCECEIIEFGITSGNITKLILENTQTKKRYSFVKELVQRYFNTENSTRELYSFIQFNVFKEKHLALNFLSNKIKENLNKEESNCKRFTNAFHTSFEKCSILEQRLKELNNL